MEFKLQFSRTAQKALDKLPSNALIKIFTHLKELKMEMIINGSTN
jgi:mRNA-degrading endonuclease RelE of RelBE toxin-antitoxin system